VAALLRKYRLTADEYNTLVKKQNGRCAICREAETAQLKGVIKRLSVDHDHVTGKVRGLLCQACNLVLGGCRDKVLTLMAAIQYLEHSV
jgi:hypothetical protein